MSKPNILVCFYRYDKHHDQKQLKKKNGLSRLTAYSPLEGKSVQKLNQSRNLEARVEAETLEERGLLARSL